MVMLRLTFLVRDKKFRRHLWGRTQVVGCNGAAGFLQKFQLGSLKLIQEQI